MQTQTKNLKENTGDTRLPANSNGRSPQQGILNSEDQDEIVNEEDEDETGTGTLSADDNTDDIADGDDELEEEDFDVDEEDGDNEEEDSEAGTPKMSGL